MTGLPPLSMNLVQTEEVRQLGLRLANLIFNLDNNDDEDEDDDDLILSAPDSLQPFLREEKARIQSRDRKRNQRGQGPRRLRHQ
jgi:hypothetical protein